MTLACQRNSYLKELVTKVVSCDRAQLALADNGKKKNVDCFKVILEDTILFPEGGGQPDDRGRIGDAEVVKVERKGATAIHYTLLEVSPGSEVTVKVNWERRFDHMQQHTGQHLITAIAEKLFDFKTTSWNLGDSIVTIELDTPTISQDQLDEIECAVNEKILLQVSVMPHLYHDKNDPELSQFRARGLPDDHEGAVRMLEIEGIDSALCCGTHLSNLSHLQAIKILGSEKTKKNKTNLLFLAGGRLLNYLGRCYQVERQLTGILKGPLDKHCELAEKAVTGWKSSQKVNQSLLKDTAMLEAEVYRLSGNKEDPVYFHFRKDADSDYMTIIVSQILTINPAVTCMVCVGDDKESGLFIIGGPPSVIADVGPKISEIMEGKGAVSGGRYRGKANKMVHRTKAEKILREYFSKDKAVGDCKPES